MSFRINTNVTAMNALKNLGMTANAAAKSTTRLSTGLRINDASDDPAGLIISESFRSQISGTAAAIRNNQDALNYAKVAEGSLDEISRLLRDARTLAVASGNNGTLSSTQLQANQNQFNLIMDSIDRIANTTAFGNKKLLDGSSGVKAVVVDAVDIKSMNISGTIGNQAITADGSVTVDVTTAATKATHSGTNAVAAASLAAYQAAAVGTTGSFSINGYTFNVQSTDTWGDVVQMVNEASGTTGVVAEATHDGTNGSIVLRSTGYGANSKINLVDATGVIQSAAGAVSTAGTNAVASVTVGTLDPVTFTGGQGGADGLVLSDAAGNRITLSETGNAVTTHTGAGQVIAGQATFQVGANAGERTQLAIGSFTQANLGLNGLDITNVDSVETALNSIDDAIEELNRRRGEIGSFMRNVLESNIRSLGVAKENLSATESSIRDIDVAEEMTNYTKLNILQQSGLSVLAQANQAPQAVLSLLRG